MKLAILGGTFNPIHIGHLICGEEACQQFGFDEIVFMPAGLPPHKEVGAGVTAETRHRMTIMATEDNPRFRVSRHEVDKQQLSYTVDTVREILREQPGTEIFFIAGADAVLEILDWKEPRELLGLATLIAAGRPGFPLERFIESHSFMCGGRVLVMDMPPVGISSTMIRERAGQGRSIRYLVPDNVGRFIEQERLYREG